MPSIKYWQGRKNELAKIQEWLSQPSTVLVGITGLGGFGKSTLAAKLLDESTASRKFWVDVRTGTDFFVVGAAGVGGLGDGGRAGTGDS
ncbi:MAG: hypothetical protein HC827_06260 [Cyanobacteria bacterium RM1_2_2]|nr:hypothetical protein [Cyanobacteria bacterium RM1_2_2]